MTKFPIFSLFKDENQHDPNYNQVKDFYIDNFSYKKPGGISELDFQQAKDQIIQGWTVLKWKVPEEKKKYLYYDQFFTGEMAAIFIKGHNFQKAIYCLWDPDVVFYCPALFSQIDNEELPANLLLKPETFKVNRFYGEKEFYYSDDLSESWKKLPFNKYSRMEHNRVNEVTQSTGCLLYK